MFLYKTQSTNVPAETVPADEVREWVSPSEAAIILNLQPRKKALFPNGDSWERIR